MWVVVGVTSGNGLLTINTPVKGDRLSSPTTITGTGSAFEGVIGQAFVLDHLYTYNWTGTDGRGWQRQDHL